MNIKTRLEQLEAIQAEKDAQRLKDAQQSKFDARAWLDEAIDQFNDPNYVPTPFVKEPRPKPGESRLCELVALPDDYWAD